MKPDVAKVVPPNGRFAIRDYSGTRYGRLMFTHPGRKINGYRHWHALCDCGNFFETRPFGTAKSCGCLQKDHARKIAKFSFKDLTGQRNGRLMYIRLAGKTPQGRNLWEARCDCGTIKVVSSSVVLSCGCLKNELAAERCRAARQPEHIRIKRAKISRNKYVAKIKQDPLKRMRARISSLHRNALRRINNIKNSPTFKTLGYSAQELAAHIEKQFLKGMSWSNISQWHIDHIVPICTARSEEDVIALNQLSNLRPIWAKNNLSKGPKREFLL